MVSVKVTVLFVPTFLLSKVPVAETVTSSPSTNPVKVAALASMVAVVLPLYVLLLAVIPETVRAFAVIFAVVV